MLFNMYFFICVWFGIEIMIKGWCGLVWYLVLCELLWNEVIYRIVCGDEVFWERRIVVLGEFNYYLLKYNIVIKDINKMI